MVDLTLSYFFDALFDRLNKENGLSDITYAMCKASAVFSRFFVETMFPGLSVSGQGIWEREYQGLNDENDDGSRIDFLYEEGEIKLVIENKLFDQNTHDEQYYKAFPDSGGFKRAFIANYPYSGINYYHCETWKSLLKKLKELPLISDSDEEKLINGYILYLSKLVNYMEAESMDFSSINSICSLFVAIKEFTEKTEEKWHLVPYYSSSDEYHHSLDNALGKLYRDDRYNQYFFCLEMPIEEKPKLALYVIPNKYDRSFITRIKEQVKTSRYDYIDKELFTVEKGWGIGLYLEQNKWLELFFGNDNSIGVQKECLENFFSEVLDLSLSYISG